MNEAAARAGALPGGRLVARLSSDDRLARRAAEGDQRAFAAIFARYHQDLYRYCLAILGNPDDAQDALQNTMVKALRALPGEPRRVELKPWLYRVAHNETIDLIRRRRSTEPLDDERTGGEPDLARAAEARERLAQLIADLQALPERQRGALVMRELSGLGFDEIGAALGASGAVARQTVYEARLGLRQIEAGREMSCDTVTKALSDRDGRVLRRRDIRAHLRACPQCRAFGEEIDGRGRDLAALSPLPAVAAAGLLQSILGGGAGAGAGGLGAGIAGGAAKGIAGSTALKATATVAVVAAIGGAAADRAHLVDLGVPGGSAGTATQTERTPPGAAPANGQSTAGGADSSPPAGAGSANGRGAAPGVAGATPLGTKGAGASPAPGTEAPGTGELPANTKGQQTAAANKEKTRGSARSQQAKSTRGPKASHPAHPPKPAHPPHSPKPSHPQHASGKGGSSAASGKGAGSPESQAGPVETGAKPKVEVTPGSGGKNPEEPSG